MSINQKSGQKMFHRRFVSGSLFVSPCPPECNFQSETKIEPDLRLPAYRKLFPLALHSSKNNFFEIKISRPTPLDSLSALLWLLLFIIDTDFLALIISILYLVFICFVFLFFCHLFCYLFVFLFWFGILALFKSFCTYLIKTFTSWFSDFNPWSFYYVTSWYNYQLYCGIICKYFTMLLRIVVYCQN